jgi:hypothetical protein
VKFRLTRSLHAMVIRSATLTREGRHWYLSLLVNDGIEAPTGHAQPDTGVGVDRGVVVAVATSAGELLDRAFVTEGERARALGLQRKLSRAVKVRPTAPRPGRRWLRCGRVSVAAGRISARKPPTSWRRPTPWWCWRNCRSRT